MKTVKTPAPPATSPRLAPYERSGVLVARGLSKKMGESCSAFGAWDGVVDEAPVTVLDKNDPNYDSEAEELQDFLAAFEASAARRGRAIDVPRTRRARAGQESSASSPIFKSR